MVDPRLQITVAIVDADESFSAVIAELILSYS